MRSLPNEPSMFLKINETLGSFTRKRTGGTQLEGLADLLRQRFRREPRSKLMSGPRSPRYAGTSSV